MRVYEVLFIIAPKVEEADVETLITQVSDVATAQGGVVTRVDKMGRRRLAYPIHKFTEGYFTVITMEGTGSEIAEIERRMRVTDSIIRYLSVRIDEDLKRAEKFKAKRARRLSASGGPRGRGGAHGRRAAVAEAGEEEAE